VDPDTPRAPDPAPRGRRPQGPARREQRAELSARSGLQGIGVVVLAATALVAGAWLLATSVAWLVATSGAWSVAVVRWC
jgi:hypothetical protein